MKNTTTLLILSFFLNTLIFAQAPQSFKYQAVARDAMNQPYSNTNLGIRISLVQDNVAGTIDYSESHLVTTTDLGVFDLQIGEGTPLSGTFDAVDWAAHPYFLKVDVDPNGGTSYVNMGTSQLLSVPYAIYANEAGNGGSGSDNQTISLSGTTLSIEDGNSVDLSALQDGVNDADADPNNEIQSLTLSGSTLSLTNGGSVELPGGSDSQQLSLSGTDLSITNGNTVDLSSVQDGVNDADANPNNELQTISKSGNTITLSNGGGSVSDDVNDADADPMNEIQDLSLSGNTLQISGGNNVNLSGVGTPPVWSLNGADAFYVAGNVGVGTNAPTQTMHIKTAGTNGFRLQGNGTGNTFFSLDNTGGNHTIFDDMVDSHALGIGSANAMKFLTGGANERMRILSNGFIGVGTIAPEFRFHVNGEFFVNSSAGRINFGSPGTGSRWRMSTQGSGANLQFQSKESGSNTYNRRVYFHQNGNVAIGNNSNPDEELVVGTNLGSGWAIPAITVGGTTGGAIEVGNADYTISMSSSSTFSRARIIATSPTGFGRGEIEMRTNGLTVGENAGSPGSYMLKVEHGSFGVNFARANTDNDWEFLTSSAAASNLNLYANGTFRGYFSGTDGTYNVSSDRRLKTNISQLESVLPNLMLLKPSRYEYIHNNPNKKQSIGFVAQEVKEHFPELVEIVEDERSKGMHAVKYSGFGVIAVKAIQEQQEIIESQATKIEAQQTEIEALKSRMAAIEALLNK